LTQALLDPRRYLRLLALLAALAAALAAVGYLPTARLAGATGTGAMVAGIAASLLATAIGGLPLLLPRPAARDSATVPLLAMALRFLVVVVLAVALALSGLVPVAPTLLWLALSYLVLLAAEAAFTARAVVQKGV
jgi:hypothetical protein